MNKITIPVILVIMLGAGKVNALSKQYNMPAEIDLYRSAVSPESDQGIAVMETRFFPIGWSQDNKFAYICYFDDYDASGLVTASLEVIDVVTDNVIVDASPTKEYATGTPFDVIWNENIEFYSDYLSQNGIVQQSVAVGDFPLPFENDTLTCFIETEWIDAEDSDLGWAYIDHLTVKVKSAGKGVKIISEQSGRYLCIDARIGGFIKNPYNARIVIPMITYHPGWEGPPNTTSIHFVGCHLKQGFGLETLDYFDLQFKDIDVFEGAVALVFQDDKGKDNYFSYFDIDIEASGLCTIIRRENDIFPEYMINNAAVNKKYRIYYKTEERWLDAVGETMNVHVIKKIESIE